MDQTHGRELPPHWESSKQSGTQCERSSHSICSLPDTTRVPRAAADSTDWGKAVPGSVFLNGINAALPSMVYKNVSCT